MFVIPLKLYDSTRPDESKLYIFLEFVTKGSLASLYRRYTLRDSQVSAYTRQILHGLKYLHDQSVVHRMKRLLLGQKLYLDIKCANILVDANGSVKLADFGLAKATKLNDVKSCKGTAFLDGSGGKHQGYGLPADMWSLGCTVLEMLTGQIPYCELECMQALFRIGKGERPPIPDSLSRDARDFIMQCLQVNPNDRATASQLLNHPFVQRPVSQSSGSSFPNLCPSLHVTYFKSSVFKLLDLVWGPTIAAAVAWNYVFLSLSIPSLPPSMMVPSIC
ncbi:hypothetical protein RIF29_11792 [Crotalaria pallida]|uniref:Protein kinase domain-containing protein n=1 Tax=Crotalaria pallida TaxID=3830 RepID=A0AAN9IMH7_CROPI